MIKKLKTMSLRIASLSLFMAFTISSPAQSNGLELNVNVSTDLNLTVTTDSENNVLIEALDENVDMRVEVHDTGTETLIARTRFAAPEFNLSDMLNGPINNLTIVGGRMEDRIVVFSTGASAGQRLQVTGDLNIDARNGFDSVSIAGVDVAGRASIRGRGQGDLIELLFVDLNEMFIGGGPGFDAISIRNTMATGRVAISGGRENDSCNIEQSSFSGDLILQIEGECFR